MPYTFPKTFPRNTNSSVVRTVQEAMATIASLPAPVPEIHTYSLSKTINRILAVDITAPFSVPGFTRSRLDGYALYSRDTTNAQSMAPVTLRSVGTLSAGNWPSISVCPGTCIRIMTGAPIPKGADAVVAFEDIFSTSINSITLDKPVTQGHGIGIKDINATQGQTILTKGTQITPVELGRISMLGITHVQVYTRPRVAVLSTGNELLLPGMSLTHGKLYNSSQFTICAFLEQSGAVPLSCGIAPDNANTIANTMRLALNNNSMLITTGGLGGGDFDLITEAMRIAGANILLSGGTFRPGGNFAAATLDGKLILALSGSPASALLAFHLLGLPHTRRLSQNICWRLKEVEVLLGALPERPTNGLLPGILKIMHGLAIFHPLSLRDLESNAVELILPLSGNEPLELWRREKTPIKAFTVGPRI